MLLYKRLNVGGFSWPRTKEEAMEVTPEQYHMLMQGLEIVAKRPIEELTDPPEYSCAMKSHFRKSGNQMSGKWKSSHASLLA